MKLKRLILTSLFSILGILFLVSPTPAMAQTFGCIYDGPTNTCKPDINACGAGYSAESDPCSQYNNSFGQCTATNHQSNACTKVAGFGDQGQECRVDGTCNSPDLSCSSDNHCINTKVGTTCGINTYKGKVTYCSVSPINREIVPNYSGCIGIGEQCLTDLSPTTECTGLQINNTSGSSVIATANGCVPNDNYKLDIRNADGSSGTANGQADANGQLTMSFDIKQPGSYTFNLYNLTTGSFSVAGATASITGIGGGSNLPGAGTGSTTGDIKCSDGNSIDTAIGCIPIGDQNALIGFFLKWGIGIGGGIAFLLIIVAGFQIMTSRGDPNRLKAGQELMTSAVAGLLLLIFSLIILRIIGFDILNITAFK